MAVQPVTDVIQRPVTILINLVVLLIVMKADAIAIPVQTVAAVLENAVVPVPLQLRLKLPEEHVVENLHVVSAGHLILMMPSVKNGMEAELVILIVCQHLIILAVTDTITVEIL